MQILKILIPNFLIYFYRRIPWHSFGSFWIKNKSILNLDNELIKMIDFFIKSESYKSVSHFWHLLNIRHLKFLGKESIKNYSTSVARSYYTFLNINENHIDKSMKKIGNVISCEKVNLFKKQNNLSYKESFIYNNLTYLLWYNLKEKKIFKNFEKLSDVGYLSYGDPYIDINDKKVTLDKINSLLDYENINNFTDFSDKKTILEIGAGSGRTTEAILTFNDELKYTICDIPPALFISYKRLSNVFKEKSIGLLYNLNEQELNSQINNYDISFIMPHQLNFIKNKKFDLSIAIDCIHEMRKRDIAKLFNNISTISNYFYFSVWKESFVRFSPIGELFGTSNLNYFSGDYKIPKSWIKEYEKDLLFPSNFISVGFKIK